MIWIKRPLPINLNDTGIVTDNDNRIMKRFPRSTVILSCAVLITAAFTIGFIVGRQEGMRSMVPSGEGRVFGQGEIPAHLTQNVDFNMFWDVWNLIKDNYYQQPVSETSLFYGTMHGLLESLNDPYSVFFDPEEAAEFNEELSGSFEGIGAEIGIKDEQLQIVAPLPDSPAESAGLMAGDKVYLIDGVETFGMTIEEAVSRIRGPKGTSVVLSVARDGLEELIDITIVRDEITIDSVRYTIRDDGIAKIDIYFFNDDTAELFNDAVNEILTSDVSGIVLDLRNNPGGLLNTAIEVASEWLGNQTIVIEKIKDEREAILGRGSARFAGIPTVVLVNEGSASGSEIVAGALQDFGAATLIGAQTFGKGSVQDYQPLPDGSAVKMTIAEWLTPNGRSINKEGITPDIEVQITLEDFYAQEDRQLEKAIEILTAREE